MYRVHVYAANAMRTWVSSRVLRTTSFNLIEKSGNICETRSPDHVEDAFSLASWRRSRYRSGPNTPSSPSSLVARRFCKNKLQPNLCDQKAVAANASFEVARRDFPSPNLNFNHHLEPFPHTPADIPTMPETRSQTKVCS